VSVDDSQEVILGHQSLQPRARSRVAARTCWERVPNKVFPDSEGELELSEATVPDGSVALLWLKLFCSNT
jgi:hypothetical protein